MLWLSGVLVILAWGVGAFGSPYPWAYFPLLIASAALGIVGLWLGESKSAPGARLAAGFLLVALGVGAQLVPIPLSLLDALSPNAAPLLNQQSLQFSLGESRYHSLSIDSSRSQLGLAFFGAFSLLLFGTARFLRRESANRLAGALAMLGATVATVGIVQRAVFNGKIYGFWELVQGGTPFGPFVNRNHFAGWMLMGIPVVLGYFLALVSRGTRGKTSSLRDLVLWFGTERASQAMLTGFAILVMVLSLVLTLSRSGMIALSVALLVAGATVARQPAGAQRSLSAGYLIFVVAAVVSWVGVGEITARFAQVDVTSINERPAIWADTVRIVRDFWLTGTGLNTYGVSTLFYQRSSPGYHLREAHSDFLQLAAEGGLLLGIPIAIAIVAFVRAVRQRLSEDVGSIWWIRMGATTGLIAIALQSVVEFSLQMPGNAAMFAVVAGLAIHDGRRV